MTKLEALKETARRDGGDPLEVELVFKQMTKLGADRAYQWNDELPPGTEEQYILEQLAIKQRADQRYAKNPGGCFVKALETLARRLRENA